MSLVEESLRFSALFEAELLNELLLRYWKHPHAADPHFRNQLLERAVEALRASVAGTQLMDGLRPENMNLVAAIGYAEWSDVESNTDEAPELLDKRRLWMQRIRKALPSCFCDPDLLE